MKPDINLFSRLLLWQKFAILGVIAIILTAIPFSFYIITTEESISNAELESKGAKPIIALLRVVQLTQQHRGLSAMVLSGNTSVIAKREEKAKELVKAVGEASTVIKSTVGDAVITKEWATAVQTWEALHKQVANQQIDPLTSFKKHTALIENYLSILDKEIDYFKLSFDPTDNYFLIRSVMYAIPNTTEALGKARATGSAILSRKEATIEEKIRLATYLYGATSRHNEMTVQLNKAFVSRPEFKAKLESLQTATIKQFDIAINLAQKEIVDANELTYPAENYFNAYTTAIDAQFELNKKGLDLLDIALQQRVDELNKKEFMLASIVIGLFALGSLLGFIISRSITSPVGHLIEIMNRISAGDSTARANLGTFDEIGRLGMQFDIMLDQRDAANEAIYRENETLNASIIDLLQAVARLSQKDLTAKVPVSEDVTGLIADALNLLAVETSKVLNEVVLLSKDVAETSQQVKEQSDHVIDVALEEKREIEQAAIELSEASEAMSNVAKLANTCNEAAQKAIKNTDKAQETVLSTVQGITLIRDTIRETEKRIKRLGERSQEIGGVVNLINNIAERTHILALNASMHAASAGEAGRGFAVVANEVQRLAENSREATSKIAALVNNIQVETADTVLTMNEAIGQVVKGTDLAQQAGSEMRSTRETTADLVLLVQRIASNSSEQAEITQRLREKTKQIQQSTEQTYEQLREQGVQTSRLVGLSDNLVESVSVFKLPA